jgi:hypothetical protein
MIIIRRVKGKLNFKFYEAKAILFSGNNSTGSIDAFIKL